MSVRVSSAKSIFAATLLASSIAVSPTLAIDLDVGTIFSSTQLESQSFVRLYNEDNVAGTVTVTLRDSATGQTLANWVSPSIAPDAEVQFSITTLENEANAAFTIPNFYTLRLTPTFDGAFQHVLWRPADGTLTNLSTCADEVDTEADTVIAFHSTQLDNGYPSTLVVTNTGNSATTVDLEVYDARDGSTLGTFTTTSIPSAGQLFLSAADIESSIGLTAEPGMFHFNIEVENAFTGYLQQLVDNQQAGVITDMTTLCELSSGAATN